MCTNAASCAKRAACCCHLLLLPFLDSSGRCLAHSCSALRISANLKLSRTISNYLAHPKMPCVVLYIRLRTCLFRRAPCAHRTTQHRPAPPDHSRPSPSLSRSQGPSLRRALSVWCCTHTLSLSRTLAILYALWGRCAGQQGRARPRKEARRGVLAAWAGRALVHCMERREAVVSTGREHGS